MNDGLLVPKSEYDSQKLLTLLLIFPISYLFECGINGYGWLQMSNAEGGLEA